MSGLMPERLELFLLLAIQKNTQRLNDENYGSGGILTHASEETGALNQCLRPLGHATPSNANLSTFTATLHYLFKRTEIGT